MKIKTIIFLTLLFLIINALVYVITTTNEEQRIKLVLNENLKTLKTHYDIILQTQGSTASTLYQATIELDRFLEIMSQARSATEKEKTLLRDELHKLLTPRYDRAKQKGVLQYHFVFPDNSVFLRMHKPSKFGDDLTDVRDDFKYVNETKKPVRGFTQGRTAHGFRNVFPLFDKNNKHIGAMEISFSSENFQWFLNNISNIHTHFLVDKSIFDAKTWTRDDLILKYSQSAESSKHMITLGDMHTKEICIDENLIKLAPIRKEMESKILKGDMFSSYVTHNDHADVFAFLPIKNLKGKTIAWLVSFEESPFIELTLKSGLIIKIITLFASLVLIYFIVEQLRAKEMLEEKHRLLNSILNATDNIMFITDCKNVSFSNSRFKNLLNVKNSDEFNISTQHNILNIFSHIDGYLHSGLITEGEDFISLLKRTPEDKRVVAIVDNHFETKAFQISISKTDFDNDYLITLSDITKMQEKQVQTEKKAYIDGLTNVYNRNKFDEIFEDEIIRIKRYKHSLSMAIIDIDKFKDFNDTHGHLVGDEVLVMMAKCVNDNVRNTDTFARWGGEEFVILFKETDAQTAKTISEKLKDKIQELSHPSAGKITASFGVTEYLDGDTLESVFKRCDEALYLAKNNGRNRIEVL